MYLTRTKISDIINKLICGDAGIGRQASLRCLCQYWRVGSSPISRTSVKDIRFSSVLYFYISAKQQSTITENSHAGIARNRRFCGSGTCSAVRQGKPRVPRSVLACGFKSHFPHRCKGHSVFECPLFFIKIIKFSTILSEVNFCFISCFSADNEITLEISSDLVYNIISNAVN